MVKDDEGLTITDGVVMYALERMPGATEYKVADATGMTVSTVHRALSRLKRLGYAEVHPGEGPSACTYSLCRVPPEKTYRATVCGKMYMLTAEQYHELRTLADAMTQGNAGIWGDP